MMPQGAWLAVADEGPMATALLAVVPPGHPIGALAVAGEAETDGVAGVAETGVAGVAGFAAGTAPGVGGAATGGLAAGGGAETDGVSATGADAVGPGLVRAALAAPY